ncbi:MAG: substrate-binding domain-containing protein [Campylobacteraceae bacterium]|nr:substrate-binding domain-containing protein [Campylobacteraceae bacterium]
MKLKSLVLSALLAVSLANAKMVVYFDSGGSAGDNYGTVISNGAKAAAKDLDVELKVYFSDWDPNKMVENFRTYSATKPDGIVIMGHPGNDLYKPLVEKAIKDGIYVTSVDTPLKEIEAANSSKGFGYAGSDNYSAGLSMANEALRFFDLKAGDQVMIWGLLSQPTRGDRAKAMIEVLEGAGLKVDYVEISPEINKDPTLGQSVFSAHIAKNPNTKVAFIDHGSLTAQMEQIMKNANLDKDKLQIAGFSLSPATLSGIKSGYVDLVGDAQPWFQGYFSIVQIYMAKNYGFSGFNINTGGGFVTKDNVDMIEPLIKDGIR